MFRTRNTFGPRPEWPAVSLVAALTLLGLGAGLVSPASAQIVGNDYAKIIMHIVPYSGGMSCNSTKGKIGCAGMKTAGTLNTPYFAFVCVVDADASKGVAGAEFGVEYNSSRNRGVDVLDWSLCGTLQFAMDRWPASGTGLLVTWDTQNKCQREEPAGTGTGVVAVAGYFYISAYSSDKFSVTRRSIGTPPTAKVADCAGNESLVDGFGTNFSQSHLGFVNFSDGGTVAGYNPCGLAKPVEETGWGKLKSTYSRSR